MEMLNKRLFLLTRVFMFPTIIIQSWYNPWEALDNIQKCGYIPTREHVAFKFLPVKRTSNSAIYQESKIYVFQRNED